MHNITLKNVPHDLYERIKSTAQENRRSINNEIINRLDDSLKSSRIDTHTLITKLDDIHKKLNAPPLTEDMLRKAKEEGRL